MTATLMRAPVAPNGVMGVLGGGQLGRMLALAAARLGIRTHVYSPDQDSPASAVAAATTVGAYDDAERLAAFAAAVDVVTYEFENVPARTVEILAQLGADVAPGARALSIAQDRLLEKEFVRTLGARTAPFHTVDDLDGLKAGLERLGRPAILKTRRLGYDGKGQSFITAESIDTAATWETATKKAWAEVGAAPSILEGFVDFEMEISVIGARGRDQSIALYDPPRNIHRGGILRKSIAPADAPAEAIHAARDITRRMLSALDYVGVIGVEFFVLKSGEVAVNEFAPRVHNSGHWTIDACACSQFEQHVRAVCGWPLGRPDRHSDAEMDNLIGEDADDWLRLAATGGEAIHLYGKDAALPGRKMGHVTRLTPRRDQGR